MTRLALMGWLTMQAMLQMIPCRAEIALPHGEAAHVVAQPHTALERRVCEQLSEYLEKVLGQPARMIAKVEDAPATASVIVLINADRERLPETIKMPAGSPEAFVLETVTTGTRPLVLVAGAGEQGLKQAVHRLVIKSRQEPKALVFPDLHVSEKPWIPQREWTVCPWAPQFVRGAFVNPFADPRMNIWLYGDDQLGRYVDMFDWFGYNGCQLIETCYGYAVMGSPEAMQDRQRQLARLVRQNGQQVSLWVWAAMFAAFGWMDPDVHDTPAPGRTMYDDPKVHATFEKYYDHYARLAPDVDMLIGHFYDPGILTEQRDFFQYMKLLEAKFKAKNPRIRMAIDSWAAGADYIEALTKNGFQDYLLLEMNGPAFVSPEQRAKLHELGKRLNLQMGVWGWFMTEYETDQLPSMYVNARMYKEFCQQVREGAFKIHPVTYWSEMEAHHLNNIYSMYAAGQLLWNPDRDPDELLAEIAEGIWGPKNGPAILAALKLIQDTRTGDHWETYWWTNPQYRIGTTDPAEDLRRSDASLAALQAMKTDKAFVPKFPLPFPPETFVELMIPHLKQIRHYADFRLQVQRIREAAKSGADKQKLRAMLVKAWDPVSDYNTWIGVFGQIELREQDKTVRQLCKELKIEVKDPEWLRAREADRLLQQIRFWQRTSREPVIFNPFASQEFYWPEDKLSDRVLKLVDDGLLEKVGEKQYRLTGWQAFAMP